jgi:hypothetical protein
MKCFTCNLSISSSSQGYKYSEPSTLWKRLPATQTYFSGSGLGEVRATRLGLGLGRRELELLVRLLVSALRLYGDKCLLECCRGWIVVLGTVSAERRLTEENFENVDDDLEDV